jgi:hypothetical protein
MKLKKNMIVVLAIVAAISSGGAALAVANPTIQSQIASLSTSLPTIPTINLPSIPNFSGLSAFLTAQFNKMLGKDANTIVDSKGNLDPHKAWDSGAGDRPVTEAVAKEYGLTPDNADRIIAQINSSEDINTQAQSADNSLDTSKQISAGIKNLMKQSADNTMTNKSLLSVTASNQKLLDEMNNNGREAQIQNSLLQQAAKPFFLFSK